MTTVRAPMATATPSTWSQKVRHCSWGSTPESSTTPWPLAVVAAWNTLEGHSMRRRPSMSMRTSGRVVVKSKKTSGSMSAKGRALHCSTRWSMAVVAASPASFQPPNAAMRIGPSGRSGWADQRRWGRLSPEGSGIPPGYRRGGRRSARIAPDRPAAGRARVTAVPTLGAMSSVEIVEATEVTPELVAAFERLIPQLSSSNPPPTEEELAAIVESPASILLLAVDRDADDAILGSLTLAWFRIPTGVRAWIEDVVVDGEARGRGVGEALNLHAIERARALDAKTVDLTSRPSREAANRLYQRIGFVPRDTNVYRFDVR